MLRSDRQSSSVPGFVNNSQRQKKKFEFQTPGKGADLTSEERAAQTMEGGCLERSRAVERSGGAVYIDFEYVCSAEIANYVRRSKPDSTLN